MGSLGVMRRLTGEGSAVAFAFVGYWLYRVRIAHKLPSDPSCLCLLLFDVRRVSLPVLLLRLEYAPECLARENRPGMRRVPPVKAVREF